MAIILDRTIVHDDHEYHIVAEFDDAAIMDDAMSIEIQASVRKLPNGEPFEQSVELRVSLKSANVEIWAGGERLTTVSLNIELDDVADQLGNGLDILKDDKLLGIEHLIHQIPGPPIFGCIVKGAASTLIGQTIRCWRSRVKKMSMASMRDVASCLAEYRGRMALTFMFRVGRCIALAGMS